MPNHRSLPSVKVLKGKWQQYVDAARIVWGDLSEGELLQLEGHTDKLAGLIQQRYAITLDEADVQVKRFFAKHQF